MAMAFTNIKQVNLVNFDTTNVRALGLAISEIKNAFNVDFYTICSYSQNDNCKIYYAIIKVKRNVVEIWFKNYKKRIMLQVRH